MKFLSLIAVLAFSLLLSSRAADVTDYEHRWALVSDATDSGTAPVLVDLQENGGVTYLDGGGADFDGTDDYLSLADGDTLPLNTANGFTWCSWIRSRGDGGALGYQLLEMRDDILNAAVDVDFYDMGTHFVTRASSSWNFEQLHVYDGFYPPVDSWVHLAVTISPAGEKNIWYDGSANGLTDTASPLHNGLTTYNFMRLPRRKFDGALKDVRLYSRALSGTELLTIMTATDPTPTAVRIPRNSMSPPT